MDFGITFRKIKATSRSISPGYHKSQRRKPNFLWSHVRRRQGGRTKTMRVSAGMPSRRAQIVAVPMRQVAQSVEAFPDDAALDAWRQQSSAVHSLMIGETADSSTSQSLSIGRTSIPASRQTAGERECYILKARKNVGKLFLSRTLGVCSR